MKSRLYVLRFSRSAIFLTVISLTLTGSSIAQSRASYLPDPKLTPGEAVTVKKEDVCEADRRNLSKGGISMDMKRRVFDRYGIRGDSPVAYDVEHLIPPGLGGSNSINNLWPQPVIGDWNHAMKDRLERRLHKMVCRGALDLKTAQQELASDWTKAYKKYVGDPAQSSK